jgi:hypothetical protein
MAKSRTRKVPGPPVLGGLLGGGGYYQTKISDGGKTRTGAGKTPQQSQQKASKKWDKAR